MSRNLGEWKKVRAGWYRRKADELWFHIKRVDDRRPGWGWDVFINHDPSSVDRKSLVMSAFADLGWAIIEADERIARLTRKS